MAKLSVQKKGPMLFEIWAQGANDAYDALLSDMINQIRAMRIMGISDEEIFNRLELSLNNGMDLFSTFKGKLEGITDDLVNVTANLESNAIYEGKDEMLDWELDPTVAEHCATCLENADKVSRTFDEWQMIGLPGMGNTDCGLYCKCQLVPAKVLA